MATFLNPALFINQPIAGGTAGRILYAGTGPVLAHSPNLTFDGTNFSLGTTALSGSSTPPLMSLGGAYGTNTPGNPANIKLAVFQSSSDKYGFGISAGHLETQVPNGATMGWYINGTRYMYLQAGALEIDATVSIPCAGSSYASPKTFGMSGLSTGNAARWQFGDSLNCIQDGQGRQMQMVGYHGIELVGAHYQFSSWPFATDTGSCVHIPSTQAAYITLLIDGKASQTADLTRWRDSASTTLGRMTAGGTIKATAFETEGGSFAVDSSGILSCLTFSTQSLVEVGANTGGSNLSWLTINGDGADPYIRCNNAGGVTVMTVNGDGAIQLYDSANDQMLELTPGDQTMQVQTVGGGACDFLVTGSIYPMTSLALSSGVHVVGNSSSGSKIGTATSQKFSFWNATPIVQPTTAVTAATFVAGAGTAVNDASTFDGYTLKQVVKALRNIGLLA